VPCLGDSSPRFVKVDLGDDVVGALHCIGVYVVWVGNISEAVAVTSYLLAGSVPVDMDDFVEPACAG
jgi:hypothetical protein